MEDCFREWWDDSTSPRRVPFRWLYRKFLAGGGILSEQLPLPKPIGLHAVHLGTYPGSGRRIRSLRMANAARIRQGVRRGREFVYVEAQFSGTHGGRCVRRSPAREPDCAWWRSSEQGWCRAIRTSDVAYRKAVNMLYVTGGGRVDVYELANATGAPTCVHSKVCVGDPRLRWFANLDRSS